MIVTEAGMWMCAKASQKWNANSPICSTPQDMATLSSALQLKKELLFGRVHVQPNLHSLSLQTAAMRRFQRRSFELPLWHWASESLREWRSNRLDNPKQESYIVPICVCMDSIWVQDEPACACKRVARTQSEPFLLGLICIHVYFLWSCYKHLWQCKNGTLGRVSFMKLASFSKCLGWRWVRNRIRASGWCERFWLVLWDRRRWHVWKLVLEVVCVNWWGLTREALWRKSVGCAGKAQSKDYLHVSSMMALRNCSVCICVYLAQVEESRGSMLQRLIHWIWWVIVFCVQEGCFRLVPDFFVILVVLHLSNNLLIVSFLVLSLMRTTCLCFSTLPSSIFNSWAPMCAKGRWMLENEVLLHCGVRWTAQRGER